MRISTRSFARLLYIFKAFEQCFWDKLPLLTKCNGLLLVFIGFTFKVDEVFFFLFLLIGIRVSIVINIGCLEIRHHCFSGITLNV